MKTRKLLPLIILAVGAVLALSSCDAILDAIFASNQITVDVAVFGPAHLTATNGNSYVTVDLTSATGYSSSESNSWSSIDGSGYVHFYFNFPKLKDDTYYLSTVYHGYFDGNWAPSGGAAWFYNPDGLYTTSCKMPFENSADSTGHSATLSTTIL